MYRVTRDPNSAEIKYYFDTDDDYGFAKEEDSKKSGAGNGNPTGGRLELPSNTASDLPANFKGYQGHPTSAPLKDIDFKTNIFGTVGGLDGKTSIRSFDPVFVNMEGQQSGSIDRAAVARALARYGGSTRDDVDQGGHQIKMRDITVEELKLQNERVKNNKASDPLPVAEPLPINPDNFSSAQRAPDIPAPNPKPANTPK